MAYRKSGFWRNFWGETGRNTGKWFSNKIFGVTGWATPRRVIIDGLDKETIRKKSKEFGKDAPSEPAELDSSQPVKNNIRRDNLQHEAELSREREKLEFNEEYEEQQLYSEARRLKFDIENASQISNQLDKLLSAAYTATENQFDINIYISRIRTGIMLLERLNENELAAHYVGETSRLVAVKRKKRFLLIMVLIVVFAGCVYFAFFYTTDTPAFIKKIEDFFK